MSHQAKKFQPIQIVRPEARSHFTLNTDALQRILLADDVKNLPVAVVSIAGGFRKGKSFLLNFFLQYMRNWTQPDWMPDREAPLEGFPWRGGSDRQTTGIWMWPEVFVVTRTGGQKIGVIFLDTQGTFDCVSTVKEGTTIFSWSMMTSSLQIYNLSQNIGEDDLQHLQLFTEYGQLALKESSERPFQKLLFLVRDWQYSYEKEYGLGGGRKLLEQRLSITSGQAEELKSLRLALRQSFTEMCCFLMPHPGPKVATAESFLGCLSDIGGDFKTQLKEMVSSTLHPDKLPVKRINGIDVSCQELFIQFELYGKIFNGDDLPNPTTIFEAAVKANNLTAVERAIDHYRKGMENVLHGDKPYVDRESLLEEHQRAEKEALELFDTTQKLGGVQRSKEYRDGLKKMIDLEYKRFSVCNESERIKAEEKKIKDDARQEANRILEEAKAVMRDAQRYHDDVMAFLSTPFGILCCAVSALFGVPLINPRR